MSQSLARITLHLVFSTKHRIPVLDDAVRESLHLYMAAVLKNIGSPTILINSVDDHAHILFELARTIALSEAVEEVKKSSSKWIKKQGDRYSGFAWQAGYGAFAVSESRIETVSTYIANQAGHHRRSSFQDEYRLLLERHHIPFNERHVWD